MTLRFDPRAAQMIEDAARTLGVSFSQFVREAALVRAALTLYESGPSPEPSEARRFAAVARQVAELARVDDQRES